VYCFPSTRALWHKTGDLPLGLMCTPLAHPSEDFCPYPRVLPDGSQEEWQDPQRVPLVRSAEPPPRCGACQAYVNPFFGADGTCNMCGRKDATLARKGALDPNALPMRFGTVEYEVGGPYVTRSSPVQPVQLYALDLTCPRLADYLPILLSLGRDMAEHFGRQGTIHAKPPRMGVCLFSAAGIVIQSRSEMHNDTTNGDVDHRLRYIVMPDVTQDPFVPLPLDDWTFDMSTEEGLQAWSCYVSERLTQDIACWRKWASAQTAKNLDGLEQSCGGAALAFLADALTDSGGRGTLITWRRPNFGVGRLPHRDEKQEVQGNPKKEDSCVYRPIQLHGKHKNTQEEESANFYKKLGADCARNRVSLDVVVHTITSQNSFLDLASLGELCRVSCGRLVWIAAHQWEKTLHEELRRLLQSFAGWDAIFKVRCSEGVRVKSFPSSVGSVIDGSLLDSPELDLASANPSTCISVELDHRVGGLPKDSRFVYFQTALLYTSISGSRRVRVSTLGVRCTLVTNDVFRSADFAATMSHLLLGTYNYLRQAAGDNSEEAPRAKSRAALYHRCLEILICYRLNTPAITSPTGQFMFPDRLQLLPLLCMCLIKSPMLRPGMSLYFPVATSPVVAITPSGDERSYYMWHLSQTSPAMMALLTHPSIFSIAKDDHIQDGRGEWNRSDKEGVGVVLMPDTLNPTIESLQDDGLYLIDDGLRYYLYVGKLVSPDIRQAVSQYSNDPASSTGPLPESMHRLTWQMRAHCSTVGDSNLRPTWLPPTPVVVWQQEHGRQGFGEEAEVMNLMLDDFTAGEKDYEQFLYQMHQRIRERLQPKK
jgi:hypothetical protein